MKERKKERKEKIGNKSINFFTSNICAKDYLCAFWYKLLIKISINLMVYFYPLIISWSTIGYKLFFVYWELRTLFPAFIID